jgi:hypothetical protein
MELVTTGEVKHITLRSNTDLYEVAIEIHGPKAPKVTVFTANADWLAGRKVGPGALFPNLSLNIVVSDKKDLPAVLTAIRRHNKIVQADADKRALEYQKNGAEQLAQFMAEAQSNTPGKVEWHHNMSFVGTDDEEEE